MSTIDVKAALTAESYQRIRQYLHAMAPGGPAGTPLCAEVSDTLVDAFVMALWERHGDARTADLASIGLPPPPPDFPRAAPTAAAARGTVTFPGERYYAAHAKHTRPGISDFTATLPMARVTLPADAETYTFPTAIGDVLSSDHLLRNLQSVVAKAYPCERVDLITPVRQDGMRFASIAIYLAYAGLADARPHYYILEAGLPQGGARMLYIASGMSSIVRRADYLPTPFASPHHFYRHTLSVDGDEPTGLSIEVFETDPRVDAAAHKYLTTTVTLDRVAATDPHLATPPLQLFREAAVRVAAIANALGVQIAEYSILQSFFAADGLTLDWSVKPPESPQRRG